MSAEQERKERWADVDVVIDFPLPEKVQALVDELERKDLEGDYTYFDDCEWLDTMAKPYINHGLTHRQYDLLRYRYYGG